MMVFHDTRPVFLDEDWISDVGVVGWDKGDCMDIGLYIGIDFLDFSALPSVAISHEVEDTP